MTTTATENPRTEPHQPMSESDVGARTYLRTRFDERFLGRPRGEQLLRVLIYGLGVFLTLYTMWYAWTRELVIDRFANVFLGVGIVLFYLLVLLDKYDPPDAIEAASTADVDAGSGTESGDERAGRAEERAERNVLAEESAERGVRTWSPRAKADAALVLATMVAIVAAVAYVEVHFDRLLWDAPVRGTTFTDHVVGTAIIAVVIDATRRAYGNVIAGVAVAGVAYAVLGPWMPGVLRHTGMNWGQVARHGAIGLQGTYSFILEIGVTWVAIFIMFAGLAKAYGLMAFVLDVGREISNVLRTGVVQIAIIASMIMGSITGSAAANTATTGSFTIPMIKDQGVRKDFACAIESVASSGGQMLPPIMGVAAFLMADIVGVPYVTIIQAGLVPAILFYFSAAVAVHLVVHKFGWTTPAEGSFNWRMLLQGIHFVVPLGVLIYTLVWLRFSPLAAGFYTILSIVPVAYGKSLLVDGVGGRQTVAFTVTTFDGLRRGAVDMAPLVGILAALGVIVEMITQTGLSQKISVRMIALAGGILVLLLVLAMVTSILFGLGMPTPAAYILVVILVAPALIDFGLRELTAHMFVFYFAMLSAITPPVAVAVAVGSRIAESDFMISSVQALRIGAPGFLIPFAFVTNDSLIYWSTTTLYAFPVVLVGVVALVVSTIGYDGTNDLGYAHRTAYMILTFGALFAPGVLQLVAAVLIVLALFLSNTGRLPAIIAPDSSSVPTEAD